MYMCVCILFVVKRRRPPGSTRTDTLFPYTTLFRSPYACPELPHVLSEGTILTIYLAFPASFSTVESPRYCPDPGQVGRGIPETPFRFRSLRAIHFCDSLWGMAMNDLPPARAAAPLII